MITDKEGVPPEEEVLEDVVVPEEEADPAAPKVVNLDEEDENDRIAKLDRKSQNDAFAAMRKEAAEAKREREELKKKVADYEARMNQPQAQPQTAQYVPPQGQREHIGGVPVPQTKAEWDALARQDWQQAVSLMSVIKSREEYAKYRGAERSAVTMEESKQRVLQRHPELADVSSDKSRIFLSILDRNPEYLTMSKGPIVAMREMEEELEAKGYTRDQIFDSKKVQAQQEATRVTRGSRTGGGKMPEKQGRTIQLSKDDLEFCRANDLDPKDYAKERLAMENNKRGA
jgi:hypothetical protein